MVQCIIEAVGINGEPSSLRKKFGWKKTKVIVIKMLHSHIEAFAVRWHGGGATGTFPTSLLCYGRYN